MLRPKQKRQRPLSNLFHVSEETHARFLSATTDTKRNEIIRSAPMLALEYYGNHPGVGVRQFETALRAFPNWLLHTFTTPVPSRKAAERDSLQKIASYIIDHPYQFRDTPENRLIEGAAHFLSTLI